MKLRLLFSAYWLLLGVFASYAQSGVAISENSNQRADASAILDVVSTSKGMLVPRMSNSQRNSISNPATGLLIYQTDNTAGFYYFNGSAWQAIGGSGGGSVSSTLVDAIPVWNGTTLIDGSLDDDGEKIGVFTGTGSEKVRFSNLAEGQGYINVFGASGIQNVSISNLSDYPDNGFLALLDGSGETRVGAYVSSVNSGSFFTEGSNGNLNIAIDYLSGNPDNGYIGIYDADGAVQASMYVNAEGLGQISASGPKNFRVPHPKDGTKEIWYAALEGPEAAMYVRGTSTLVNGEARIELPEHFTVLAVEKSVTVITTPLSASSNGLAVVEKNTTHFLVKELMNGTGSYEFDWEVKCIRKGFENYKVVRPKAELEERQNRKPTAEGLENKAQKRQ